MHPFASSTATVKATRTKNNFQVAISKKIFLNQL